MIIAAALIVVTLAYGWYTWPAKVTKVTTDTEKPSPTKQESPVEKEGGSNLERTALEAAKVSTTNKDEELSSDADSSGESQGRAREVSQANPAENV